MILMVFNLKEKFLQIIKKYKSEEELALESISIKLPSFVAYHGSNEPNIESLNVSSERTTLGYGVYLTDKGSAINYAQHRAEIRGGIPTIYEVSVKKVHLADLRSPHHVKEVVERFRQKIQIKKDRELVLQIVRKK